MFSVALSIASRRPAVSRHPALRSPDFPLYNQSYTATARPAFVTEYRRFRLAAWTTMRTRRRPDSSSGSHSGSERELHRSHQVLGEKRSASSWECNPNALPDRSCLRNNRGPRSSITRWRGTTLTRNQSPAAPRPSRLLNTLIFARGFGNTLMERSINQRICRPD